MDEMEPHMEMRAAVEAARDPELSWWTGCLRRRPDYNPQCEVDGAVL